MPIVWLQILNWLLCCANTYGPRSINTVVVTFRRSSLSSKRRRKRRELGLKFYGFGCACGEWHTRGFWKLFLAVQCLVTTLGEVRNPISTLSTTGILYTYICESFLFLNVHTHECYDRWVIKLQYPIFKTYSRNFPVHWHFRIHIYTCTRTINSNDVSPSIFTWKSVFNIYV